MANAELDPIGWTAIGGGQLPFSIAGRFNQVLAAVGLPQASAGRIDGFVECVALGA